MIFIQCKSAAIKLIVKRISRVFWFCCGGKLQKYQTPVAIKTQCQTKLLTFRLELKWRVWAERQSLALNYEFEWTERQTQLLFKSSVLKRGGEKAKSKSQVLVRYPWMTTQSWEISILRNFIFLIFSKICRHFWL